MRKGRLGYEMLARSSDLVKSVTRLRGWEVSRWRCWMTRGGLTEPCHAHCSAQRVTKLVCGGVFAAAAPPCLPHPILALPPAFPGVDVSVLGKRKNAKSRQREASEVQASCWSVLRRHVSFADNADDKIFFCSFGVFRRR